MGIFSAFSGRAAQAHTDELDSLHKDYVDGHLVYFDDRARKGVWYLDHDLSRDEARVFFAYAQKHRHSGAEFEDDHDHQYTLSYLGHKKYKLERR